ncbi:MAG: DUF2312 domain-containing protein [Alphaproteobacteria bacterium]
MTGFPKPKLVEENAGGSFGFAPEQLRQLIERIERLEEEKEGIANDIREVFAEAKGVGFDVKIIRQILKIRKMDKEERQETEELLDVYMQALGMVG